jgi:tetratricopeptide (TPR) repeat protein
VHYFKGYCNYELSRYNAAIKSYTKAIEINPDYAAAIYNRGAAKAELKNFEGGAEDFEAALAKNPELENGRMNIALSKLARDQLEGAIKDFDLVIEKRDENLAKAYFYRGEAYYELNNKEKACDDWLKSSNLGYDKGKSNIEDFCGSVTKPRRKIEVVF